MKPVCTECGRGKFDRQGRCAHCQTVSWEVEDAILKARQEAERKFKK